MADGQENQSAFVEVPAGSEWRFELEADEDIAIRVQSPDPTFITSAEIPAYAWYPLCRGLKGSVYAPKGARIEVTSLPASQYISDTTTQPALISVHVALEKERILAKRGGPTGPGQAQGKGPRVMVLGPPSSGKTTVVKSLVNMACASGMGWSIGVLGLDPASPSNLIPGSLSLSTPTQPIPTHHLAHPLGPPPASVASSTLSADVSTVGWWFGHLEPTSRSVDLWERIVGEMGQKWEGRCMKDVNAAHSGLIIDTPASFVSPSTGVRKTDPKARYPLLLQAVEVFDVNIILVIGHEKLSIDLSRLLPSHVRVVRFPKSGGVVDRDEPTREAEHAQMVRSYFYGEPLAAAAPSGADGKDGPTVGTGPGAATTHALANLLGKTVPRGLALTPYSFQIGWETLSVLRVGEETAAPTTALPLGSSRILSPTRLSRVDPTGPAHVIRLLNTVLAVVALQPGDRVKPEKEKEKAVKDEPGHGEGDAAAQGTDAGREDQGQGQGEGGKDGQGGDEAAGENEEEEEEEEEEVPYAEEIGWREVLGFVVITAVDTIRKKYTVLSPSPGKLPSKVAIAGAIEWVDSA